MDVIEEWKKRLCEYTDAPELMIEATAYYLISATLGEFFKNPLVPIGSERPNLWIVLSSIPARMRRSTIQRLTYKTFKDVMGKEAEKMVIEEGTPEGILDAINELEGKSCTIQSTEFGGILTRMRTKDYEIGVSSLLSKLYYGEGGKQSLSKRGGKEGTRFLPEGLYVTMLTGLQEPKLYFTPEMLAQGLLRRLIVVYVPKADRWKPPIDQLRQNFNMQDIVQELRNRRIKLEGRHIDYLFTPDAEDKINSFAKEMDRELDRNQDNVTLYKASMWEHLAKISAIHAINRFEIYFETAPPLLSVKLDDVDKAKLFLNQVIKNFEPVIEELGVTDVTDRSHKPILEKIFRKIRTAGSEGITLDQLGRTFSGYTREELSRYLETLRMQDRIVIKLKERKGPGRPSQVIVAKEFE
ncbi:MAG: DUF3987 domain-containing protein [Nitrososphaeria archaeon]